jgi:di/tricarboxylate transporter
LAVETASQLNLEACTFAITIALPASCSFLTPLEPACLLVYRRTVAAFGISPRWGALLAILIYAVVIVLVPLLWPV